MYFILSETSGSLQTDSDDLEWKYFTQELKEEVIKVAKNGGKVFVELKSSLGDTTRIIASNLPVGSKLYAINTWNGIEDKDLFSKIKDLAHKIRLIRSSKLHLKDEIAEILKEKVDFLFIDVEASQHYDSLYNDTINWYPKLSSNGVICGDDWNWPSVKKALTDVAAKLDISVAPVSKIERFWKMDRNINYQTSLHG